MSHVKVFRTSVLSLTLDNQECDLLVIWDRPNHRGEQPKVVELEGQVTHWERVQLVREDDVRRGTYFHLTLQRMPVGIQLRMRFRVDGEHAVDDRYETEPDDGFGNQNNLFLIPKKHVVGRQVSFPVPIPFVGYALEAEQRAARGSTAPLESAALPQDMITTTRLYHSYMYINDQRKRHPEMTMEEIKKKAERAKVSKQKSKKLSKGSLSKSSMSQLFSSSSSSTSSSSRVHSSASSASLSSTSSASHRSSVRSSVRSSKSQSSSHNSQKRRTTNKPPLPILLLDGAQRKMKKKKRRPPSTQAGTLTYCQGLSIYELEHRMADLLKASRIVAGEDVRRKIGRK